MLKVKVPLVFLGTQGFSARREGRYSTGPLQPSPLCHPFAEEHSRIHAGLVLMQVSGYSVTVPCMFFQLRRFGVSNSAHAPMEVTEWTNQSGQDLLPRRKSSIKAASPSSHLLSSLSSRSLHRKYIILPPCVTRHYT
jgi:hypothetical protein